MSDVPEGDTDVSDTVYPEYEPRATGSDECLDLTLEAPETYVLDSTFTAALNLKNICSEAYTFYLGGNPAHDFLIVNSDNLVVWRWSRYWPRQDILAIKTLAPNEVLTYAMTWDGVTLYLEDYEAVEGEQEEAGEYQVIAVIDTVTISEEDTNVLEVSSALTIE